MAENSIIQNRSKLKEFLASIATIRGDLSNITAPPFVLDSKSTVELPAFWADRPSIFVAAASQQEPKQRALLVLRWFLYSLRNQQYAGRQEQDGVKKPLNAYLGELYLAEWQGPEGLTRLISEQVSHHPPITACRVWNDDHGVVAEGYTQQEVTFSGRVNVKQSGFATIHIAKFDETYLIPLPDVKIKGILSGTPYPEIYGTYHITSTNNFHSVIDFIGEGFFGGNKHNFEARLYQNDECEKDNALYIVKGSWNSKFTIHDISQNIDIETVDISTPASVNPTSSISENEQDPWETQQGWKDVRRALNEGNMQATVDAKSKVEKGQRALREREKSMQKSWKQLFFQNIHDQTEQNSPNGDAHYLSTVKDLLEKAKQDAHGLFERPVWRFDWQRWDECFRQNAVKPPFHGDLRPDNTNEMDMISDNGNMSKQGEAFKDVKSSASYESRPDNNTTSHDKGADKQKEDEVVADMLRDIYQSQGSRA